MKGLGSFSALKDKWHTTTSIYRNKPFSSSLLTNSGISSIVLIWKRFWILLYPALTVSNV